MAHYKGIDQACPTGKMAELRDAPLDSQEGGRKLGSGQGFFSPPNAAKVVFLPPLAARFFLIFMHLYTVSYVGEVFF